MASCPALLHLTPSPFMLLLKIKTPRGTDPRGLALGRKAAGLFQGDAEVGRPERSLKVREEAKPGAGRRGIDKMIRKLAEMRAGCTVTCTAGQSKQSSTKAVRGTGLC